MNAHQYMLQAIEQAEHASGHEEVPVGAVLVYFDPLTGKQSVFKSHNRVEETTDATAHAELLVIQDACKTLGLKRLEGASLYVTLEPCPTCAAAISHARIERLYFGAYDPKSGGVDHGPKIFSHPTCHHVPEIIGGMEEARCSALLTNFFEKKRQTKS